MPFQQQSSPSSEYALLESIKPYLGYKKSSRFPIPIGDDAAIRVCNDHEQLALTADSFVQDVHFSLRYMTHEEIGYKAMAINLSDCAAMGAAADAALVQIIFPQTLPPSKVTAAIKNIYKGFSTACDHWKFPIIGGNVSAGPCWIIDITLLGRASKDHRLLLRKGAHDNDGLWVTGFPGMSAAGLGVLQSHALRKQIPFKVKKYVDAHIHPIPRIEIGLALSNDDSVHCAMDISDGISKDARTMAHENNMGIILMADSEIIRNSLMHAAKYLHKDWQELFFHGGEEYELLFGASANFDPRPFVKKFGVPITKIGNFARIPKGVFVEDSNGLRTKLKKGGWDHMHNDILKA